jgi:hypothetical protein
MAGQSSQAQAKGAKGDVTMLFSAVSLIVDTNTGLYGELHEAMTDHPETAIGTTFCKLAPTMFSYYSVYVNHQSRAMSEIAHLQAQLPGFTDRLLELRASPEVQGLGIADYLIKPFQRVLKYPLLLREVIRHTDDDHPDFANLTAALAEVNKQVAELNENKAKADNLAKMLDINARVSGLPRGFQLVHPQRQFIRSGDVRKISGNRDQERRLFLFNDLLMYCKRRTLAPASLRRGPSSLEASAGGDDDNPSEKFECRGMIFMKDLEFEDEPDSATVEHAITVTRADKNLRYILYFARRVEKSEWLKALAAAKQTHATLLLSAAQFSDATGHDDAIGVVRLYYDATGGTDSARDFKTFAIGVRVTAAELLEKFCAKCRLTPHLAGGSTDLTINLVLTGAEEPRVLEADESPLAVQLAAIKNGVRFPGAGGRFEVILPESARLSLAAAVDDGAAKAAEQRRAGTDDSTGTAPPPASAGAVDSDDDDDDRETTGGEGSSAAAAAQTAARALLGAATSLAKAVGGDGDGDVCAQCGGRVYHAERTTYADGAVLHRLCVAAYGRSRLARRRRESRAADRIVELQARKIRAISGDVGLTVNPTTATCAGCSKVLVDGIDVKFCTGCGRRLGSGRALPDPTKRSAPPPKKEAAASPTASPTPARSSKSGKKPPPLPTGKTAAMARDVQKDRLAAKLGRPPTDEELDAVLPKASGGSSGSGSGSSSTAVPPSTSPSAPASAGSASSPPTTLAAAVAQMGIRGVLVDERWARQYQQVCAYLHAEENPSFWLAVEEYRRLPDLPRLAVAESIFRRHLSDEAVQQVNVSSGSITGVADSLRAAPPDLFDACQAEVLRLMEESAKTNDLDELVREASAEEGPTGAATSSSALPSLSLGKFRFGGGGSGGADSSGSGEKGDAGTQVGSNAAADDDGDRTGLKSPRAAVSKLAGTLRGLGAKK